MLHNQYTYIESVLERKFWQSELAKNLHFYGTNAPFFSLMIQIKHYVQLIVARAFFSGSISQAWSCKFYIYHEHGFHASNNCEHRMI